MATDIDTRKTKLHRLMQTATPASSAKKTNHTLPVLLIITILGTMLPFQAAITFFSLSFVTIGLLSLTLMWARQIRLSKKVAAIIGALVVTSVISGCSPAINFQTQPQLITFAHANDLTYHSISRIGIMGLGLDDASIETAQAESGIKMISGAQIEKGYGLISVVTITIAGKV